MHLSALSTAVAKRAGVVCCVLFMVMGAQALAQNSATDNPGPTAAQASVPAPEKPATAAEEKPPAADDKPAIAEQKSAPAEEKPVIAQEKPMAVEEKSAAAVDDKPAVVEPKPAAAEAKPAVAQDKPAAVEEKSAAVDNKPAIVEPKPAVVEAKPAAVEQKPAPAVEKPAVAHTKPALKPKSAGRQLAIAVQGKAAEPSKPVQAAKLVQRAKLVQPAKPVQLAKFGTGQVGATGQRRPKAARADHRHGLHPLPHLQSVVQDVPGLRRPDAFLPIGCEGWRRISESAIRRPRPKQHHSIIGRPIQSRLSERTARSGGLPPCKRASAS